MAVDRSILDPWTMFLFTSTTHDHCSALLSQSKNPSERAPSLSLSPCQCQCQRCCHCNWPAMFDNGTIPSSSFPPIIFQSSLPHMLDINQEDLFLDCSQAGEKKRRLSLEQVKTLEKSFEIGSKLEPERKVLLARALGLQPRQIAIWFQNRRARWKTKQLEKDYEELNKQLGAIQAENDALRAHNKRLQLEIMALKGREISEHINLNYRETEGAGSNKSENSTDINVDISRVSNVVGQQLLQSSSKSEAKQLQDGDNLCTIFCNSDDQSGFWTWPDHQNLQ